MDSWYGDLQNSGSAEGSLVKSGLFLREFVTVPWVHLDIAGTAYFRKAMPFAPRGATGVSHATLVELALAGAGPADRGRPTGDRRRPPTRWSRSPGCSGAAGFALGLAADRFATRWPEHDEEHPPGRPVDWRTAVVRARRGAGVRAAAAALRRRSARARRSSGRGSSTLIIGLATDLDQRLLPDVLTLPVIPVALVYALSGANPLVGAELVLGRRGRGGHPGRPVPAVDPVRGRRVRDRRRQAARRRRAAGRRRAGRSGSVIFALLLAGVVLVVLLAARRIGRRTYVPFGPFLIIGALWAVLIRDLTGRSDTGPDGSRTISASAGRTVRARLDLPGIMRREAGVVLSAVPTLDGDSPAGVTVRRTGPQGRCDPRSQLAR